MKLEEYKNFDDKFTLIGQRKKVYNISDIDEIFKQFNKFWKRSKNRLIFRGVKEATYKMFTSSQREWIVKKPNKKYENYLKSLLKKSQVWNNGFLKQYLNSLDTNLGDNNLAYFSIMQQYGLQTPLLDFTYNPFVALYFACEKIDSSAYNDDIENIQNYFSIYFIYPGYLTYKNLTSNLDDINLAKLSGNVYQIKDNLIINNNPNIIAQNGLYLVNTSSNQDLISVLQQIDNQEGHPLFYCYNIYKGFANNIRKRLIQMNITQNILFPDSKKLKNIN